MEVPSILGAQVRGVGGWDTVLSVRDATCEQEIACNDDDGGLTPSTLRGVALDPGTYHLLVDGYTGSASGAFHVDVDLSAVEPDLPEPPDAGSQPPEPDVGGPDLEPPPPPPPASPSVRCVDFAVRGGGSGELRVPAPAGEVVVPMLLVERYAPEGPVLGYTFGRGSDDAGVRLPYRVDGAGLLEGRACAVALPQARHARGNVTGEGRARVDLERIPDPVGQRFGFGLVDSYLLRDRRPRYRINAGYFSGNAFPSMELEAGGAGGSTYVRATVYELVLPAGAAWSHTSFDVRAGGEWTEDLPERDLTFVTLTRYEPGSGAAGYEAGCDPGGRCRVRLDAVAGARLSGRVFSLDLRSAE